MKLAIFVVLAVSVFMGVSCSPVKFNVGDHPCTVAVPCASSNGLFHVGQDFQFTTSNRVDIIVVDDNSGSMTTEQNNLGSPFNGFISGLENARNTMGLDYQIAITTTDVCPQGDANSSLCASGDNGLGGQIIGPSNANPPAGNQYIIQSGSNASTQFNNTIRRSETGSGDERAIFALNKMIDAKDSVNAGLFRADSNLAVVILSDEDERSVGGTITNDYAYAPLADYDQPSTFVGKVNQTFGSKNLLVNSIIIKPGDSTCLNQQAAQPPSQTAHYGNTYVNLSQMTNGAIGSICDYNDGSFAAMLTNITGAIANQPQSKIITLAYNAASQPVVTFNPAGNAVSWTWDGANHINLAVRPAGGTTVHVEYDYNPTTQKVFAKGMYVDPRTYQISFPQP